MKVAAWDAYTGNWVRVNAGQNMQMDILVGERPGVFIQEESGKYEKNAEGRLILPLFRTTGDQFPRGSPLEQYVSRIFSKTGPVFKGD
jgi:hypothetical protein